MNINEFIFSRTQPKKKIETIKALSVDELLSVRENTVKKIVKEVGRKMYKSRNKELYIDGDRRVGNSWNATVENVDLIKDKLYIGFYVQYENTDTNTSEEYDDFFNGRDFRGELRRSDRYGNGRTYYFCFDKSEKANVMKSILLDYVYKKYNDKLHDELALGG